MTAKPVADIRLDGLMVGQLIVLWVAGALALTVVLLTSDRPWFSLGSGLAGAVAGAGVGWVLVQRRGHRRFDQVEAGVGPARRAGAAAAQVGVVYGLVAVAGVAAVVAVEVAVLHQADAYLLSGPLLLAAAGVLGFARRDLLRWQEGRGVIVCTRAGAPRVAWTRAQAQGRLLLVPSEVEPA